MQLLAQKSGAASAQAGTAAAARTVSAAAGHARRPGAHWQASHEPT